MKIKINVISSFLVLLLGLTSCNLDYAPENTLVDEKVYKNEKTAQAALMGAYVRLDVFLAGAPQDQNNYANSGYLFLMGDIMTDNLTARESSSDFVAAETGEYTTAQHDGMLYQMWNNGYNAIDMANNVISGIQKYGDYDPEVERRHIAEAKFIRAYVYFYLLTVFGDRALLGNENGDGVILCLDPYNGYNPNEIQGRKSNADCWKQILQDLEIEALPDLSDEVPQIASRIRANKTVAKALLSRIYLYRGTYNNNQDYLIKSRDYAKEVIQTAGYGFSTSSDEYSSALFPSNEYSQSGSYPDPTTRSNELIFFQPSRIYTDNYPNGMYYYRKTSYFVPSTMKNLYDEKDVRRTYLIWSGSKEDNVNDSTTMKYSGGQYDDVLYIRMAEMKLTYAETLARTSNAVTSEAINQLNDVHQRAFPEGDKPALYTTADFPTLDSFLKAVLTERNRELAYEGHYRWDLARTNNLLGDTKLKVVDPGRWNLPIPDYEIRISNGVIKQNSGYNE